MSTLPPGDFPDIPDDPRAVGGGGGYGAWWSEEFWPALWPRLVLSYPNVGARDAELAGLGSTDRAFAFVEDTKTLWRWTGTAWGLAAPWSQKGTAALAGDGTNPRSQVVTFPQPFTATPTVTLQITTSASSTATVTQAVAGSVTTTGFTIFVLRNNTTSVGVDWIATQAP